MVPFKSIVMNNELLSITYFFDFVVYIIEAFIDVVGTPPMARYLGAATRWGDGVMKENTVTFFVHWSMHFTIIQGTSSQLLSSSFSADQLKRFVKGFLSL